MQEVWLQHTPIISLCCPRPLGALVNPLFCDESEGSPARDGHFIGAQFCTSILRRC